MLHKGWRKELIGKECTDAQLAQFLALKDAHIKPKRLAVVKARKPVGNAMFGTTLDRIAPDPWMQKAREVLKAKDNPGEKAMRRLLQGSRVSFFRERPIVANGRKYFIDFLVTSIKGDNGREKIRVAIEVDGGYHFTPEQQAKDRKKDADLLTHCRVWSVLRISSDKAMTMTRPQLREYLLSRQRGSVAFVY